MMAFRDNNRKSVSRQRHLLMVPKREKMISRSSSVVTGLSLQTNSTFSGGRMSASGRSPTWTERRASQNGSRLTTAPPAVCCSPSPAGWPESWPRSRSASLPAPPLPSPPCRRSPRPLRSGRSAHGHHRYGSDPMPHGAAEQCVCALTSSWSFVGSGDRSGTGRSGGSSKGSSSITVWLILQ